MKFIMYNLNTRSQPSLGRPEKLHFLAPKRLKLFARKTVLAPLAGNPGKGARLPSVNNLGYGAAARFGSASTPKNDGSAMR
jgi:hypothetical protein